MKETSNAHFVIERFARDSDILAGLTDLARTHQVSAGSFMGIGAVEKANVGNFKGDGQYETVEIAGPLEVTSCVGNISLKEGQPFIHAHITLADREGRAYGGHMMPGCIVSATFEITLQIYSDKEVLRKLDPGTKLFLLET
jgi:predicted DNA-binding protein with PD1-like motif